MPTGPASGFFGKIPARGDFVTRGLPASFLDVWETWIASAIAASRDLLGDGWDQAWMTAPVWRFSLRDRVCGPDPVLGLMMPSVDRVGRCYPLLVAAVFVGHGGTPDTEAGLGFLDASEDAARAALADDLDPDVLAERLVAAPPATSLTVDRRSTWWTDGSPCVDATTLVLDGMPPMPDHAAMLAGDGRPGGACR